MQNSNWQLYPCDILASQKKIEPHLYISQFIWQDLAIACKGFNKKKWYVLSTGI